MTAAYRFLSPATAEAAESINYYNEISADLGRAFTQDLDDVILLLRKFPKSGAAVDDDFRAFPFHQFPYKIVYKIENDEIVIVSVAHQNRRPGYWKGRL